MGKPTTYASFEAKSASMVPLTSLSPLQGPASPGGENVFFDLIARYECIGMAE